MTLNHLVNSSEELILTSFMRQLVPGTTTIIPSMLQVLLNDTIINSLLTSNTPSLEYLAIIHCYSTSGQGQLKWSVDSDSTEYETLRIGLSNITRPDFYSNITVDNVS